jgi:hypothetical protein
MAYKNIDLELDRRSSNAAHTLISMSSQREAAMAEMINNTEGPVIALVGMAHVLEIMGRISPDKKPKSFVVIGKPPAESSDVDNIVVTPWMVSVLDSRTYENRSIGVAAAILNAVKIDASALVPSEESVQTK